MQTKEQIKNWKVVASFATVAALGVSGLAVASPNVRSDTPPPIEIEDRRDERGAALTTTTAPRFEIVGGPSFSPDDSLDTPLASAGVNDSPAPSDSPDRLDSTDSPAPTTSSTTTTAPSVNDSPDHSDSSDQAVPPPADSPDPDDSPELVDSPETVDSVDSVDAGDSLDS